MSRTRLSSKGQVIIPKALRQARGWEPGTAFEIEETTDGLLLRPSLSRPVTTLEEVVGCLQFTGPPRTLADMDEAVRREAKRRARR